MWYDGRNTALNNNERLCEKCQVEDSCITIITFTGGQPGMEEHICQTCDDRQKVEKFLGTGEISSGIWIASELDVLSKQRRRIPKITAHQIVTAMGRVSAAAVKISESCMRGYFAAIEHSDSGVHGKASDFEVLGIESAGRGLITIKDANPSGKFGGAWVSLIYDATSPKRRLGVQGLCATEAEAIGLINAFSTECPKLNESAGVQIF